ncbi:MAG: hypothetical protein ACXWJZ_08155 [Burkholderiaceae bacterium]
MAETKEIIKNDDEVRHFEDMVREAELACGEHNWMRDKACPRQYVPKGESLPGWSWHRCGRTSALMMAIEGLALPTTYNHSRAPEKFTQEIICWDKINSKYVGAFSDPHVVYSFYSGPNTHWIIINNSGAVFVCGPKISTYFSPSMWPCVFEAYWQVVKHEAAHGNNLAKKIVPLLEPYSAKATGSRPYVANALSACVLAIFDCKWDHKRHFDSCADRQLKLEYEAKGITCYTQLDKKSPGHNAEFLEMTGISCQEIFTTTFDGIEITRRPGDDLCCKTPESKRRRFLDCSFDYTIRGPFGHLFERYATISRRRDLVEISRIKSDDYDEPDKVEEQIVYDSLDPGKVKDLDCSPDDVDKLRYCRRCCHNKGCVDVFGQGRFNLCRDCWWTTGSTERLQFQRSLDTTKSKVSVESKAKSKSARRKFAQRQQKRAKKLS